MLLRVHKILRQLSDRLVGCRFDPYRDVVLITGGAQGLGRELVLLFVAAGAKVAVLDVNVPHDDLRVPSALYVKCDVSDSRQVARAQEEVKNALGTVTILINNAGITTGKDVVSLSYQEIETTIGVNLMSSFYTIKTFLPDMLSLQRGYIVTIASVLGYMSPARLSAYGASKSGLIALHESLTYELGPPSLSPTGVKTLLVCPGQLKTGMFSSVRTPSSLLAPELEPKFVAKVVFKALDLGRRGEIKLPLYGHLLPVLRAFPWPVVEFVRRYSGMDKSLDTFKNAVEKLQSMTRSSETVSNLSSSLLAVFSPSAPASGLAANSHVSADVSGSLSIREN